MIIHPKLAFAEKNLTVRFQTISGSQELTIALRIAVGQLFGLVRLGALVVRSKSNPTPNRPCAYATDTK